MMFWEGGIAFWTVAAMGIIGALIFFERILSLRRARIDYRDFLKGVCNVLEKGNPDEAVMLCDETPGPVANVVATAIQHREGSLPALREAVENNERAELSRLERRLAFLAVSCEVAPLCGLFGTLQALLRMVRVLGAQNALILTTDLTGGLTQAVLCVMAGVLVAIQSHVMYAMLMSRIERITLEMEAAGSEIITYLSRQDRSML